MTTQAHDDSSFSGRQGIGGRPRARRLIALVAAASAVAAAGIAGAGPVAAGSPDRAAQVALVDATRPLVISEFRVRGPNGANDEFIEITNVSNTDHVVAAVSGTGYALAASNGVARCVIPNGTLVPAFGSYLCVNSVGYSLASYPAGNGTTATGDATYTTDIPDNAGIALFNTDVAASFTFGNRLDAVGSTSEANTIYKEGTGYPALTPFSIDYSFYRNLSTSSITSTTLDTTTPGVPKDTDNNAADFVFVDTNGTSAGAGQRLGAPGPSNLSSPRTNGQLAVSLLDPCVGALSPPNAVRDFTSDPANNSTFGTVDLRRTITNTTGGPVTRLRLRVADVRTFPAPSGFADMRPRTSTAVVVTVDRAPCGSGTSNVVAQGTTLEQPPSQPNGGGFNSSMSVGTVTLATPLAPGASVDVRVLTGLQQTGNGAIRLIAEALTSGGDNTPHEGDCLPAPSGGGNMCSFNNTADIVIPTVGTASPYPSTIQTSFATPDVVVTDVDVRLDGFSHTFPTDVDVMLVAPDGTTSSVILSDTGGATDINNVTLELDDEASGAVPNPITPGTFRPTETAGTPDSFPAPAPPIEDSATLSNFDGVKAEGTWSLYVIDDAGGDPGVIHGWGLELETAAVKCEGVTPTIVGTDAGEVINGTPGNDVIVAFGGDDTINAGSGNDRICAGTGDDTIKDQGGKDRALGQNGADTLLQSAVVDNGDLLSGGPGTDEVSYFQRTSVVKVSLNNTADDGKPGENDRVFDVEDVTGGQANDVILGSNGPNRLAGGQGKDRIEDLAGADTVFGNIGEDTFVMRNTPDVGDVFDGGGGTDLATYTSRPGNVFLSLNGIADDGGGGEGDNLIAIENLTGGAGKDKLNGNSGPNVLIGGVGNDEIIDQGGADNVIGGKGNDVFRQASAPDAGDRLDGGNGTDSVHYTKRTATVILTLAGTNPDDGEAGEGDRLISIENATTGSGDDQVTGSVGDNRLTGGGGSDGLKGLAGADLLFGNGGQDQLHTQDGVSGNDTANGGAGTDSAAIDVGDVLIGIP